MRITHHKIFWVWDYDKEEAWLNEMSSKGLALISVGFCTYVFEEAEPNEYSIRLELLNQVPSHQESQKYLRFLEETGVEHVGSYLRWAYFRQKKTNEAFHLFSDNRSRIAHLNRILTLLGMFAVLELYFAVNNLFLYFGADATVFNLSGGMLTGVLGVFIAFGFLRIHQKKRALQKELQLFE